MQNDEYEASTTLSATSYDDISVNGAHSKFCTVHLLFGLLCTGMATALTCVSALSSVQCDDALKNTEDAGDHAFDQCIKSATEVEVNASLNMVMLMESGTVSRLEDFIMVFSFETNKLRRKLDLAVQKHNSVAEIASWNWVSQFYTELFVSVRVLSGMGMKSLAFSVDGTFAMNVRRDDNTGLYSIDYNNGSGLPGHNSTHSTSIAINSSTGEQHGPTWLFPITLNAHPAKLVYDFGVYTEPDPFWLALTTTENRITLMQSIHWKTPDTGIFMGIYMTLSTNRIARLLRDSAGSGRMYIVVAASWLAPAFATSDPRLLDYHNDTGLLVATSHNVTYKMINGGLIVQQDVDAPDLLTSEVAIGIRSISGGYETALKGITMISNTSVDNMYVSIKRIKPARGIDWYVVLAVSVKDVLAHASANLRNIYSSRISSKNDAKKLVDNTRYSIIGAATFITIILMTLGITISCLVSRPISRLKREMKQVSHMNLDRSKQSLSLLYEMSEIQKSFEKMVTNLNEFRAYVPSALLGSMTIKRVRPPEGDVALVFTDIVGSTALWNKAPQGMDAALETHNKVMREWCQTEQGYEVKTIGDAFMIAFPCPFSAMRFCCGVQEDLVKQTWPEELDLPPISSNKDSSLTLWNGIRVRMGCHYGPAILEENPLTGRSDYRGTTINKASRVEAKAFAGTVCITDEVVAQLMQSKMESKIIADHGVHDLKGLGTVHLNLCITERLSERLEGVTAPDENGNDNESTASSNGKGKKKRKTITHNVAKKTQLALSTSEVTVASCKMIPTAEDSVESTYNQIIRAVADAAAQTDGVLENVTGECVFVSWNTSKTCKLHTTAAMRFTTELKRRAASIMQVGLSTGIMLHGNVGTAANRFHSTFGLPLQAACAAAAHATTFNTFAIVADCTEDGCVAGRSAVAPFVRVIDSWFETTTQRIIKLYHLQTTKLLTHLEDAWGMQEDCQKYCQTKLFYSIISQEPGSLDRLRTLCDEDPSDVVLNNLHKLLSNTKDPTPTYRVKVTFTNVPAAAIVAV